MNPTQSRNLLTHRLPLLAVLAAFTVLAPTAWASPARTVTATYLGSGLDSFAGLTPALYGDVSGQGGEAEAVTVSPRAGERFIRVSLVDKLGRPVLAAVVQHLGPNTFADVELGRVCSGTPARFRLAAPGHPVTIYLLTGSCPAGPSLPTTGSVTVEFTKR